MGRQRFDALIEKGDHGLGWTIARVPFTPRTVWTGMVRLRVAGEVNGAAFRSSLFPEATAKNQEATTFYLLINRALQKSAQIQTGSRAQFMLWPDLEPRPAELPDELALMLDEEPGLRAWYDELSESVRREIGKWIGAVKSEEAGLRRSMQMAERLLATMEAEEQLPPLIAAALRRHPGAETGWGRMTMTQRRSELMGVFYYQSPEARARRVARLCAAAVARAQR